MKLKKYYCYDMILKIADFPWQIRYRFVSVDLGILAWFEWSAFMNCSMEIPWSEWVLSAPGACHRKVVPIIHAYRTHNKTASLGMVWHTLYTTVHRLG